MNVANVDKILALFVWQAIFRSSLFAISFLIILIIIILKKILKILNYIFKNICISKKNFTTSIINYSKILDKYLKKNSLATRGQLFRNFNWRIHYYHYGTKIIFPCTQLVMVYHFFFFLFLFYRWHIPFPPKLKS